MCSNFIKQFAPTIQIRCTCRRLSVCVSAGDNLVWGLGCGLAAPGSMALAGHFGTSVFPPQALRTYVSPLPGMLAGLIPWFIRVDLVAGQLDHFCEEQAACSHHTAQESRERCSVLSIQLMFFKTVACVTGILQWQPVSFTSSFSSFLFSDLVFVLGGIQTAPTFFFGGASLSAPALGCWPGTC